MQNIIFYVAANETLGVVKDYANAKTVTPPTLVRGVEVCLKIRLFASRDGTTPYPLEAFANVTSWQWAMDNDFSEVTAYKLAGDNGDITVGSVTEIIDEEEIEYTEISIPMSSMNTEELSTWLGTEKSKSGLIGELIGFDAGARQIFVLQIENFTVRNRITSLGDPTEISPDYLTAAQVTAMIAAGVTIQFSVNGVVWHDVQTDADRYLRFRSAAGGSAWSEPLKMIEGAKGDPGSDSFCYIAYASSSAGADFSFTPSNVLKYRAEIHAETAIHAPSADDFANAVWIKYIGDDGQGKGDMLSSKYDPDGDGKVTSAASADQAAAVAWSGITGKPTSFTPATHSHDLSEITSPVYQKIYSAANPKTLYLDYPVIRNSTVNTSAELPLEFTAVSTKQGGASYSAADTCLLTWEYHVTCSQNLTGIIIGSVGSSMVGIKIPETLELINNANTVHVFVVRGVYKSGAVNNLQLQVNYAYSYGA